MDEGEANGFIVPVAMGPPGTPWDPLGPPGTPWDRVLGSGLLSKEKSREVTIEIQEFAIEKHRL